ncbi:MAG: amidohydrolase family protein, partial [Dehalococcoidales bacterium]|nr:amidohydrolase family protein [Dehalococcoidales bacterium]
MLIDFHTHVFSPRVKEDRGRYVDSDPCFALLYANKQAKIATAEDLIESMDKNEVDVSAILNLGWSTHDLCVETNNYILEAIARYPKRLVGFCAVQPSAGKAALDELERCARGGIKGIGELRPDMQGFDVADMELMRPVVETLKKHNLIFLTHTSEPLGHMYPGKGKVTPDTLYPLFTNFPELPVVCAHWGGGLPFYALMPEVKQAMKNVYFDTAASPYLYSAQIYSQATQLVGAEKILFGSDYPLLSPARL